MPVKKQSSGAASKSKAATKPEKPKKKEIVDSTLDEVAWHRRFVNDFCHGDETHLLVKNKPLPIRWARYYVDQIVYDEAVGRKQALRWVDEAVKIMGGSEGLTALQELILDGDINTAMYQIGRLVDLDDEFSSDDETGGGDSGESGRLPMAQGERSILHYAALTSQEEMCRRLMEETPFIAQIHEGDVLTGFSPLHIASFVQNRALVYSLLTHGANIDYKDNYGSTVVDYLKLQSRIPSAPQRPDISILFVDRPNNNIGDGSSIAKEGQTSDPSIAPCLVRLSPEEFVARTSSWIPNQPIHKTATSAQSTESSQKLDIATSLVSAMWTSQYKITDEYVEELLFGGYEAPTKIDMEFREKYLSRLDLNMGEDNVIVAYINDEVGWGCYAAKNFKRGEFIVGYLGEFASKRSRKIRSYSMASSVDGIILDASKHRNLGAYLNHSASPNAEAQGIFHMGCDRIVISATQEILAGTQICIDYGEDYFKVKSKPGKAAKAPSTSKAASSSSSTSSPSSLSEKEKHTNMSGFQDMMATPGSMPTTLPAQLLDQLVGLKAM
jgi:hypothetical protein